jgi:hypothetical protein
MLEQGLFALYFRRKVGREKPAHEQAKHQARRPDPDR